MASFKVRKRLRILVFCRVGSFAGYWLAVHRWELLDNLRLQLQAIAGALILFIGISSGRLSLLVWLCLPPFNRIIELILEELRKLSVQIVNLLVR